MGFSAFFRKIFQHLVIIICLVIKVLFGWFIECASFTMKWFLIGINEGHTGMIARLKSETICMIFTLNGFIRIVTHFVTSLNVL